MQKKSLNVLVLGGDSAQSVSALLRKLERHAPNVRVCGVVYQSTPNGPDKRPDRGILASLLRFASMCVSATLHFVHGNAGNGLHSKKTAVDELSALCAARGWSLLFTSCSDDRKILEIAHQNGATVGVAVGLQRLPSDGLASLACGWVWSEVGFIDSEGNVLPDVPECATPICKAQARIYYAAAHESQHLPLVSVDLSARPLDTGLSLKLKSNLVVRDLLIQTLVVLAENGEPRKSLPVWVELMLPATLIGKLNIDVNSDQLMPPSPIRSKWKLLVYLLIEFSPFVVCRNWAWRWRKRFPVIILAHHLISDRQHHLGMPTDMFFRLVQFLQKYYRIVGLAEAISQLNSGTIGEPTIVLTFDDGYEENFLTLRAVAEETDISIATFVCPGLIEGKKEFDHDLKRQIRGFHSLSWDQIRYWSREKVDFANHTYTHFDCGTNSVKDLQQEIVQSKAELEKQLGYPIWAFAFPFGKRQNISEAALEIAQTNYEHFASCFGGVNFPVRAAAPKHLLRKGLYPYFGEVELDVQGVFDLVRRCMDMSILSARGEPRN